MPLTPHTLIQILRLGAVMAGLAAVVALTGPFRYDDLHLPFPDTVAHALLFYALTLAATGALPRSRAFDVALVFLGLGAASELAQSLVGREMSFNDLFGDTAGVALAYAPIALGRLRELARSHPHATFAELRRQDRRRIGRPRAAALVLDTIA